MTKRRRTSTLSVLRGCLLAVSSATLAVSAHAVAGGGLPNVPLTVLLAVLIGWTSTAAADKVHDGTLVVTTLAVGQLMTHEILTLAAGHHAAQGGESTGMTAAHAVATLATAALVTGAHRALAAFAAALARLLPSIVTAPPVPGAERRLTVRRHCEQGAIDVLLTRICARRGPPLTV